MKNSNYTIGNRTRYFPACGTVVYVITVAFTRHLQAYCIRIFGYLNFFYSHVLKRYANSCRRPIMCQTHLSYVYPHILNTAGLRVGPAVQLPWAATLHGAQRRHWNNRKYGGSKIWCPHAKEFFLRLSAILIRALKNFSQPCPKPKV
jgi:hypothetical protein